MSTGINSIDTVPTSTTHPTSDCFYAVWNGNDYRVTKEDMRDLIGSNINGVLVSRNLSGTTTSGTYISSWATTTGDGRDSYDNTSAWFDATSTIKLTVPDGSIKKIRVVAGLYLQYTGQVNVEIHINGALPTGWSERGGWKRSGYNGAMSIISPPISVNSGDVIQLYNASGTLSYYAASSSLTYFGVIVEELSE